MGNVISQSEGYHPHGLHIFQTVKLKTCRETQHGHKGKALYFNLLRLPNLNP